MSRGDGFDGWLVLAEQIVLRVRQKPLDEAVAMITRLCAAAGGRAVGLKAVEVQARLFAAEALGDELRAGVWREVLALLQDTRMGGGEA